MNNLNVFNDSQNIISNEERLKKSIENSIINSKCYDEQFLSNKNPCFADSKITVEENLTLLSARKAAKSNKTAVLNFANPIEPGGGVTRGANAQEEYLCRASTLYNCLVNLQNAGFYDYHRALIKDGEINKLFLASDKVLYTPNVVVFKEDSGYTPGRNMPFTQVYTENWFKIDILTCSAPYFCDESFLLKEQDLKELFERRIKNIFEVAIEQEVEVLILGAFGCGVFCNPPELVANVFKKALSESRYSGAFKEVVFSIKKSFSVCRNLNAFKNILTSHNI